MVERIQQVVDSLTQNGNEQEAFIMLGIIFSFLFFAIIGIAFGQTVALLI